VWCDIEPHLGQTPSFIATTTQICVVATYKVFEKRPFSRNFTANIFSKHIKNHVFYNFLKTHFKKVFINVVFQ